MKFTIFSSLVVALLGAHTVSAACCTECGGIFQKCMDDCEADGTSSTVCGKVCYGQGVSHLLVWACCSVSIPDNRIRLTFHFLIDWLCLRL